MRDIRIWPCHSRWNICIKFLWLFIIAIFSNICNCAHFSLDCLSSTDGNYEKPSHTATTKINLSETANVQIPTKPSPLTTVPFLRTWAGLRPCSRSEVNQQHQKVTQTQEPSITMILPRFTSPAWEWMNFLTVFRKPSRHIFNFIHRISPREISHISNYLDRLSTFCSDFSFLPTTNQVHIWVHEAQ